jgi:hypothetical protein
MARRRTSRNLDGELIIVQFTPESYTELDRIHLLNPTSRSGYGDARVGTNRHIVLRNDEEIICVSMDANDY